MSALELALRASDAAVRSQLESALLALGDIAPPAVHTAAARACAETDAAAARALLVALLPLLSTTTTSAATLSAAERERVCAAFELAFTDQEADLLRVPASLSTI